MALFHRIMALCFAFFCVNGAAYAQEFRIQSIWKPDQQVHVERGAPEASAAPLPWLSARWTFEKVDGDASYRIRNVWKGTYLNVEKGKLDAGTIQPGWLSARWRLEPAHGGFRIVNVWTNAALNVEKGALEASAAQSGWLSAAWKLDPNVSGGNSATAVIFNGRLTVEKEALRPTAQTAEIEAVNPASDITNAANADYDCNRLTGEDLRKCLDANIGQPTRDFFTKTIPAPFQSGGAVAKVFGDDPSKYQVKIDFCHPSLSATETTSNITVEFWTTEGYVDKKVMAGNTSDCGVFSKGELNFYLETGYNINQIQIKTDGGDAMFVDQARLYKGNDTVIWEGRDGGNGWCLSTEANDHVGGWENNVAGACQSTLIFKAAQ
ncbi:MAG: RICIN domain-containing protein [Sphingomonadales bacterium]|nr:RICIN domain-containing protein [Sphingomonadales bacterium]